MNRVSIRSFAMIREIIGQKRILLEINPNSTIPDVINQLITKYPNMESLLKPTGDKLNSQFVFAIDGERVAHSKLESFVLDEGSELAILPPTGGG